MTNFTQRLRENRYVWQIVTLMSGTLIAQIIMFAFIPILTRLYTPAEFGTYSLFFSLASMLGMVSSWKYDQAIMLPKSERYAQSLVFLSILITLGMVLVVVAVLIIFYSFFLDYFHGIEYLIWLLPFAILTIGLLQIFDSYSSRCQFYKKMASVKVATSIATVGTQTVSRYGFELNGLIVGKVFADIFGLFLLIRFHLKKQTLQLKWLSKRNLKVGLKRHDHFPKYQSFSVLINSFSQNLPLLLFPTLFSPAIAGFYALTYRVLQAPILLIASSTKKVYYQKASKMYAEGKNIHELYSKTTLGLLKLFIFPLFIILLWGEEIFGFVFGDQWGEAGVIAQVAIFVFLFSFITPPATMNYSILNLQKAQLKLQIIQFILRLVGIFIGYLFFDSYMIAIVLFVLAGVVVNSFLIVYMHYKLK